MLCRQSQEARPVWKQYRFLDDDEQGACTVSGRGREHTFELAGTSHTHELSLHPKRRACSLHLVGDASGGVVRIPEDSHLGDE